MLKTRQKCAEIKLRRLCCTEKKKKKRNSGLYGDKNQQLALVICDNNNSSKIFSNYPDMENIVVSHTFRISVRKLCT